MTYRKWIVVAFWVALFIGVNVSAYYGLQSKDEGYKGMFFIAAGVDSAVCVVAVALLHVWAGL